MPAWLLALAPLLPLALGLVPAASADRAPRAMRLALIAAMALALLLALAGAVGLIAGGPTRGWLVHYDAVSAVMLLLVAFIGFVVAAYSRRYLDGDPGQGRFAKWLGVTLAAVMLLPLAGNLTLFALGWVGTSLGLHRLLLFYPERPAAQLAARKKFLASRAADAALLLAFLCLAWQFGTIEVAAIRDGAAALAGAGAPGPLVHLAAFALALAAVLKSAQFPAHGWLPEVMETPTPVSALLHAGIINAGGFLLVRMADVVALSAGALDLLVVVGAVTAVFGAAVMLTQTSVKVWLAWSTVAQMGFMVLQCGLGAFAAALLHIVAHGLYKAHAFLSAGGVAQARRAPPEAPLPLGALLVALGAALALTVAAGAITGMPVMEKPGVAVLGAALMLGLAPMLAGAWQARRSAPFVAARVAALGVSVCFAYFLLQRGAEALLGAALPTHLAAREGFALGLGLATVLAFAALLVLNLLRRAPDPQPWIKALYVHIHNGFYVNALANRLVAQRRGAN
jgi:NAD(P)H-quinone oxidoreductase subunit 5